MNGLSAEDLERVAAAVGTPFYAYSAAALRTRAQRVQSAVANADFCYSLKANPNKSIVRVLTEQGVGAEVCSVQELMVALTAGVSPGQIIFVGPAKTATDVALAVEYGIKAIIAESIDELKLIDRIAADQDKIQNVALRINPEFHTRGARLSMSGKPTQFGIDQAELEPALDLAVRADHLRLAGFHVYMGTRILDHKVVLKNTSNILALACEFMDRRGLVLDFVDIGGGFGIAYSAAEKPLDLETLGKGLTQQIETFRHRRPDTRVVIELGRYLVGEAGVFVTRVQYVKRSKDKVFAICDGGSNTHAAAAQAASFKRNFPVRAVRPRSGKKTSWNLSGPLCTPTDLIAQDLSCSPLEQGDLIRIDQSGAYGLTFSPAHFLSFETPAEIMVDGADLHLIRRKSTLADHLAAQEAVILQISNEKTEELSPC